MYVRIPKFGVIISSETLKVHDKILIYSSIPKLPKELP